MPEDLKLGRQLRDEQAVEIRVVKREAETKLSFPLTSGAHIDRWYGTEILSHEKDAIRLDRVKRGAAPLLFNHNWDDPIGMVDGARIEDGRLVVDAHLFDTERARQVAAMVDGGLRNVSAGYLIHAVEERTKEQQFTVIDWEPLEASIVTVPADPSVGIGREADADARTVRVVRKQEVQPAAPAASQEKATMAEVQAAAGASAENEERKISAVEAEKERRQAIINLCKVNRIDGRVEARWIEEGTPLTVVSKELLDVMEERGKKKPGVIAELGLSSAETRRYSIFKAMRALAFGGRTPSVMNEASFEMECSRAVAKNIPNASDTSIFVPAEILSRPIDPIAAQRAMATIPGSKGGYLVPVENMGFVDILRNRSVVRTMGARVLSGLVGNVTIPRQTGKATVTWQAGENVSVNPTDQALGQLSLTPRTAITVTNVSEQLLRQSSPSAEDFIMTDLASVVAIDGVDYSALKGAGGAQPIGIANTTGIHSSHDTSSATYAKILGMPIAAGNVNALLTNPGFVASVAGSGVLMQKQRFSGTDTPLWDGNLLDGNCVGFRGLASNQLGSAELMFGSWGELVIGEWGVLELALDTGGSRFDSFTVGIRAVWMVDVVVRHPQAFVYSINLSA